MTTQKQPQAGEWWESQNRLLRVFVIGIAPDGVPVVCEQDLDPYRGPNLANCWQHLPDCDGWDWQPETFPQYWTAKDRDSNRDVAFVELKQDGDWIQHYRDGGEYLMTVVPLHKKGRTQLTKEQAEALLDKPQESPPQPSPKRVPVRLWVSHNDGSLDVQYGDDNPSSHMDEYEEIKHDANGFYVEVQQ